MRVPRGVFGWMVRKTGRFPSELIEQIRFLAPDPWAGEIRLLTGSGLVGPGEERVLSLVNAFYRPGEQEPVLVIEEKERAGPDGEKADRVASPGEPGVAAGRLLRLSGLPRPDGPSRSLDLEVVLPGGAVAVTRAVWAGSQLEVASFVWRGTRDVTVVSWGIELSEEFLGRLREIERVNSENPG